jgi:Spy/CpxP family protein refolding chaperone
MKSKRIWSMAAVALCGLLAAGAAFAQDEAGGGRRARGQRQERMTERRGAQDEMGPQGLSGHPGLRILRDLDLTPEQREQIKAIHEKYAPRIKAAHEAVLESRKALREAGTANPVNEGAIRSAANQVGTAVGDLAVLVANRHAEVRAVLTTEQQAKFDATVEELPEPGAMMEQRGGRRGGRGGEGRGPRGGPGGEGFDGL